MKTVLAPPHLNEKIEPEKNTVALKYNTIKFCNVVFTNSSLNLCKISSVHMLSWLQYTKNQTKQFLKP